MQKTPAQSEGETHVEDDEREGREAYAALVNPERRRKIVEAIIFLTEGSEKNTRAGDIIEALKGPPLHAKTILALERAVLKKPLEHGLAEHAKRHWEITRTFHTLGFTEEAVPIFIQTLQFYIACGIFEAERPRFAEFVESAGGEMPELLRNTVEMILIMPNYFLRDREIAFRMTKLLCSSIPNQKIRTVWSELLEQKFKRGLLRKRIRKAVLIASFIGGAAFAGYKGASCVTQKVSPPADSTTKGYK